MNLTIKTTLDFGCMGEREVEIEGRFYPGRPAQTSGPPERCYPEEPGEFDGRVMYLLMGTPAKRVELPPEFIALVSDETFDKLNEQAIEEGADAYRDSLEDDRTGLEEFPSR